LHYCTEERFAVGMLPARRLLQGDRDGSGGQADQKYVLGRRRLSDWYPGPWSRTRPGHETHPNPAFLCYLMVSDRFSTDTDRMGTCVAPSNTPPMEGGECGTKNAVIELPQKGSCRILFGGLHF
jgi:hypothetical protein